MSRTPREQVLEQRRAWYAANREKVLEQQRVWRVTNPEKEREHGRKSARPVLG